MAKNAIAEKTVRAVKAKVNDAKDVITELDMEQILDSCYSCQHLKCHLCSA